jgi:hypothetical protein
VLPVIPAFTGTTGSTGTAVFINEMDSDPGLAGAAMVEVFYEFIEYQVLPFSVQDIVFSALSFTRNSLFQAGFVARNSKFVFFLFQKNLFLPA